MKTLLPDLRTYLLSFDYEAGIRSIRESNSSRSVIASLLTVLDTASYQQFAWASCSYFVAAMVLFLLEFLLHVLWTFWLFKCGCRRRDPTKSPKIYSKASKIFWGLLMSVFLVAGAAAAALAFLQVQTQLLPISESIFDLLWTTLPDDMTQFRQKLLSPLSELLANGYEQSNGTHLTLSALQQRSTEAMAPHVFLNQQTRTLDVVSQPVFAILNALQNYSLLFPTPDNSTVNCSSITITPSDKARMTVGAQTGCFQCKACATLSQLVANAKDVWRRNAFQAQIDLLIAKLQLEDFGASNATLVPAISVFQDGILGSLSVLTDRTELIASQLNQLIQEMKAIAVYGLLGVVGLSGLALLLGLSGFCHGIRTNKRTMARSACFFGELAMLLALLLTGVLYTIVTMARDGIVAVQLLDANASTFLPLDSDAAVLASQVLYDQNLVNTSGMNATLAFADTLHVPPHPEPFDDSPGRVNISALYNLPDLFAMETTMRQSPQESKALNTLFQWSAAFVTNETSWLKTLAFGNASQSTPYNASIYQELLNSTVERLLDPNNDSYILTDSDRLYIDTVFNATWYNLNDFGVRQNQLIATQWFFVAQLYNQERRLLNYTNTVADIIDSTRPLLSDLVLLTSAMENAEFKLKAPVEFFTDAIRASKINDCSYNNNCGKLWHLTRSYMRNHTHMALSGLEGWFRQALNELFALFQELITQAERAVILCAASAVTLLLGVCFAGCFASRLCRNVIKVYSAKIHADG